MLGYVIVGLLILLAAGERMIFVALRRMAESSNSHWPGAKQLLLDGWVGSSPVAPQEAAVITSAPAELPTTSGFDGNDFMAHARLMDARKQGVPNSPAKKIEGIMASNDQAQRKLRSKLIGSGLGL